jgi:hypothetical protein
MCRVFRALIGQGEAASVAQHVGMGAKGQGRAKVKPLPVTGRARRNFGAPPKAGVPLGLFVLYWVMV